MTALFDIDGFLRESFIARVATNGPEGPSIRPVLYLWEDGAFWWVTSSYAHKFFRLIELDARVALVIDSYDPTTGFVRKVTAAGIAEVLPLDRDRARSLREPGPRGRSRCLGPGEPLAGVRGRGRTTCATASRTTCGPRPFL